MKKKDWMIMWNHKPNLKKALQLLIYLALIALISLWILPSLEEQSKFHLPDYAYSGIEYEVGDLTPQFEQLWVKAPVVDYHRTNQGGVHLDAINGHAFMLANLEEDKAGDLALTKLDLLTGEIEWFVFQPLSFSKGAASTIDVNSELIYIGFEGTQKISGETTFGAGKVVAYEIDSGKVAWSRVIPGSRGIETLVATDSTVSVDGAFSSSYYLFDAATGELIDKRKKEGSYPVWFINDGILYDGQKSSVFQAVDVETNSTIWQSAVGYATIQPPVLTDKVIVARSGETRFLGIAFAIDITIGDLLWEYRDIASNVTVSNSFVFFLTQDRQLMAVDIETGKVLGMLNFISNLELPMRAAIPSYVASSNDMVVVYLGDSHQLFAFRFLPDG